MSIVVPNFPHIWGFLYFLQSFKMATIANRNGRNMVQHVLLPVNIHFHWNLFILEFLIIFLIFILASILKILKTKSTTLSDGLFLCEVSKGSDVWSEFNIICSLVTMATAAILILFNPSKAVTHYCGYSYKVSWSLMKGIQFVFKSPTLFPWQLRQSLSNRFRFFSLSRSTRRGCCFYQVSSISVCRVTCYDHFCVFYFFIILAVSMATAAILEKSTLKGTTSHVIWYSCKVS